jgi:steroid delta-isomerase-like uncharacterized protein
MSERNKELIRRMFDELANKGNLEVVDEVFDTNLVAHEPGGMTVNGPRGYRQIVESYRSAMPDMSLTVESAISEDDMVAARWSAQGNNTGSYQGIPASGKKLKMSGIIMARIAHDRIVEVWEEFDAAGMLQQMGVIKTPAAARR